MAFRIPEGRYGLRVSAVGYETRRDSVVVRRGRTAAFETRLDVSVLQGGEAVVEAAGEAGVGVSVLDPRTIRDMPLVLADAIRAVQTELGVTSSNELSNDRGARSTASASPSRASATSGPGPPGRRSRWAPP